MEGMGESAVSICARNIFYFLFIYFAGSLQNRNKESDLFRQPKLSIAISPVQLKSAPPILGLTLVF